MRRSGCLSHTITYHELDCHSEQSPFSAVVQPEPQHAEAWLSPETNVSPNLRRQTIVSQESHHGLGGREQQSAVLIFFGSVISFPSNIKRDAVWQEHGGISTCRTQITPARPSPPPSRTSGQGIFSFGSATRFLGDCSCTAPE